jgi:hypothetical protein
MGGDIFQWTEKLVGGTNRMLRGGAYDNNAFSLEYGGARLPDGGYNSGFRLASVLAPEPSSLILAALGAIGLLFAARRNR